MRSGDGGRRWVKVCKAGFDVGMVGKDMDAPASLTLFAYFDGPHPF